MDRKKFIKNSILGITGLASLDRHHFVRHKKSATAGPQMAQVGFNHIPNHEVMTKGKSVLHRANTRGQANHGWLQSRHTFSFANYRNPERMNFGVLRVLNDDIVSGGKGFGTHPHSNMEIISIPLEGDLEHKDSMGNAAVIRKGDVQVMSAGTGIYHSEYNKNEGEEVKFLQIWMFPNKKNVEPRYDQISLDENQLNNQLYQVLSPNHEDEGVWVHQNAWFHMGQFDQGTSFTYDLKDKSNGVYFFVLEGSFEINAQDLEKRDGLGLWDAEKIDVTATSNARILVMEVPMEVNL